MKKQLTTPQEVFQYLIDDRGVLYTGGSLDIHSDGSYYICIAIIHMWSLKMITTSLKERCLWLLSENKPSKTNSFSDFTNHKYWAGVQSWWSMVLAGAYDDISGIMQERRRYLTELIKYLDKNGI